MVGDNSWNFWWGFSMFCEKLQNVCLVEANPDQMDKNGYDCWTQRPPKPTNPLQTSSPQKICTPVNPSWQTDFVLECLMLAHRVCAITSYHYFMANPTVPHATMKVRMETSQQVLSYVAKLCCGNQLNLWFFAVASNKLENNLLLFTKLVVHSTHLSIVLLNASHIQCCRKFPPIVFSQIASTHSSITCEIEMLFHTFVRLGHIGNMIQGLPNQRK